MERAAARLDLSSDIRAQRAAFCWRLRVCRRCGVLLLSAAEVTRAMWAIVARGAVVGVRAAREAASVLGCEDEGLEGDDRLMFSPSGDLDGEKGLD